jgi:hypothetical protein
VKWRKTFQGIGIEALTEEMIENELKTGKTFFYKVSISFQGVFQRY